GRQGGTSRLRSVFDPRARGAYRAQSAHRRGGEGTVEARALFQARQGNARTAQRRLIAGIPELGGPASAGRWRAFASVVSAPVRRQKKGRRGGPRRPSLLRTA